MTPGEEARITSGGVGANMEWTVKLEAKTLWGEVETIEVGKIERRVVGLTAEEIGLTLAEGKDLLAGLVRLRWSGFASRQNDAVQIKRRSHSVRQSPLNRVWVYISARRYN